MAPGPQEKASNGIVPVFSNNQKLQSRENMKENPEKIIQHTLFWTPSTPKNLEKYQLFNKEQYRFNKDTVVEKYRRFRSQRSNLRTEISDGNTILNFEIFILGGRYIFPEYEGYKLSGSLQYYNDPLGVSVMHFDHHANVYFNVSF